MTTEKEVIKNEALTEDALEEALEEEEKRRQQVYSQCGLSVAEEYHMQILYSRSCCCCCWP